MAIITLTTDLGLKDHYVASIKGAIFSQIPEVTIVDITHNIEAFNISQAAFVIRNCYKNFPQGSIHILGVDAELSLENSHLAVFSNGHYFIGTDNGCFSLLFDELKPEKIVELNISQNTDSLTFPIKDVFVIAACHIARGGSLEIIGKEINEFKDVKTELKPVIEHESEINKDIIKGAVIYIDSYGNAATNINKKLFEQERKGRNFIILFGRENEKISKIVEKYKDAHEGEKLAIFGTNGMLEIAQNKGRATDLLGLKLHDYIRIEFKGE
ncbi:MAG: SAM-dependent chlorinase/fluorinase [Flavobacteriales bacterium]|nr:SAM-dependent chlorinase/fluorinase [Flavobacteriales bacterium]